MLSPRNTDALSLTESMQMVDEILSDGQMDRMEKIEKLEAILTAVTGATSDESEFLSNNGVSSDKSVCKCQNNKNSDQQLDKKIKSHVSCQTLSTGDIVITRVFVTEEEKEREKLLVSPKK